MATPAEISAARELVLNFIQNQNCPSIEYAIKHFNRLSATGNLPEQIARSFKQAWQKPRNFILTLSTYDKWQLCRKRRGHCRPLVRQKDFSIKPWHSLAERMRRRSPKSKCTGIYRILLKQYPDVSIYQLRRFFRRIEEGTGK